MTDPLAVVNKESPWMLAPSIKTEYPGLAYVIPLEEIIIVKQRDAFHDLMGEKPKNCFTIFNKEGEKVFIATQKKRFRSFDIKVFNHYGNQVIQVERPFRQYLNWGKVWAPPGNFVAAVKEQSTCVSRYKVQNWYGVIILDFKAYGVCDLVYKIRALPGRVGILKKNWKTTDYKKNKHFGMKFPQDMNMMDKIALIGTGIFIGCLKYF